ncbi:MAG: glycosyltransferase [Clostridium sp.]
MIEKIKEIMNRFLKIICKFIKIILQLIPIIILSLIILRLTINKDRYQELSFLFIISCVFICLLILIALINLYKHIKYRNKNKKKRVVFGINSLKIGGAERALVDLVKKIYNAYDVTIYTIYGNGTFEKELQQLVLDKKITLKTIFKKEPKTLFTKKIQMLLLYIFYPVIYTANIKNIYDVEIAFVEGIMTKMFALESRAKKIAWVHFGASKIVAKQQDSVITTKYELLKKVIDRITYLKYNDIIFVSNTAKENFLKEFGDKIEDKVSMHVIYKYLDIKRIKELSEEYIPEEITPTITSIVTVAKIIPEKGIDRLLDVHERLIKDGFIHNIYVIGDGIDRERLINETKKRKLKHSFRLVGEISNPYPYIKNGNYFALLSKVEGYGIVIDEAKVLRKEILITKTASIEAVQKYSNIHIFENTEEDIYNGIKKVLGTREKNKKNKREIVNNLHIFERINDSKIYDIINIINK